MAPLGPLPITAVSLVNGMGRSTREVLSALDAGRPGLASSAIPLPFSTVVGAVPGELPPLPEERSAFDTRLARIGLMALREIEAPVSAAVARWGPRRVAILIGTSTGGLDATEVAYETWARTGRLPPTFDLAPAGRL